MISFVMILALALSVNAGFAQQSYDYENMDMDTYKTELAKWQQREAQSKTNIAAEEKKIEELKKQLAELDKQKEDTWNEIYATMGTDKAGYEAYKNELKAFEEEVAAYAAMSPEEIYNRKGEIAGFEKRLAEYKADPKSATTENQNTLAKIGNLISQAKSKMSNIAAGMYEVQRGDYLWKIAKKGDVYGDPYAWIRIYDSNKDKIKNPDLIYPNQVFSIPKIVGANEYLVMRGQSLSKIAGMSEVYGSPFKWMKLYNANKEKIQDPNVIYPYQVLKIER
jgi:nucleoid-associated protein YgaU